MPTPRGSSNSTARSHRPSRQQSSITQIRRSGSGPPNGSQARSHSETICLEGHAAGQRLGREGVAEGVWLGQVGGGDAGGLGQVAQLGVNAAVGVAAGAVAV